MADQVHSPADQSVTTLVAGIINDTQELLKQQMALIRSEIRDDFQKTKEGALALTTGAVVCLVAGILLCLMLVHLLNWAQPVLLPLWACYAIVGGVCAAAGGALVYLGVKKFQSFNPLPNQSVEGLKENLQWQTNRR
jgi:Putative Actinobacterial Holin-X, holin superfamily III